MIYFQLKKKQKFTAMNRTIKILGDTYTFKNAILDAEFNTLEEVVDVFKNGEFTECIYGYIDLDAATDEELTKLIGEI
jgi:hypothetical protein